MKRNLLFIMIAFLVAAAMGGSAYADTFTFTQNTPFVFAGTTLSSVLAASGVTGNVTDVNVTLNGVRVNAFALGIEEFDILLVGPQGQKIILMSFACDATAGPVNFTFDGAASGPLSDGTSGVSCVSGTYLPSDYSSLVGGYILDPPAPAPPYSTNLADLNAVDANGNWTLYAEEFGGDEGGTIDSWTLTIETDSVGCPNPPTITTTTLPNGAEGVAYSQTVQATGGTPPYAWSISAGTLPPGLAINATTGEISGTPTVGSAGTYNFTVMVTDTVLGCSDTQDLSITIDVAPTCIYEDLFDDGVLTYDEVKPVVTETVGNSLVHTPTNKKAYSNSGTDFAGIQNGTITAEIMFTTNGELKEKGTMLTHWVDKKNLMEIQFNIAKGKVIVKQKADGVLAKDNGLFAFAFDQVYTVVANYDGTDYEVSIDGTPVVTLTPVGTIPSGILGFTASGLIESVSRVCVTP